MWPVAGANAPWRSRFGASLIVTSALLVTWSGEALAHPGEPLAPQDLWRAWNVEPILLLGVGVFALVYARGVRIVWRQAGRSRGIRDWQVAAGIAALLALIIALISPLYALSGELFSAHMAQHLLLILAVAPLLVFSGVSVAFLVGLPSSVRRRARRAWRNVRLLRHTRSVLTWPLLASGLHAVVLSGWHTPALYLAALQSDPIHAVEHVSLLSTALLFWWLLVRGGTPSRVRYGIGVLGLFALALHGTLLGALMAFSPTPWYDHHAGRAEVWGLAPLWDQQLAGLLMLLPSGMVYLIAALWLFALWLRVIEESVRRKENGVVTGSRLHQVVDG